MPKNNTLPEGFTVQQPQQGDDRVFIPPGSLDVGAAAIPGSVTPVAMGAGSVTFSALVATLQQSLVPAGTLLDFGGASAPTGFLVCDGSSLSTSAYPGLFAAIGYSWGGAGSSFSLPDARGRTAIGAGTGAGLSARTLAQTLGEETHQLSVSELASHNHPDSGHGHSAGDYGHGHSGPNLAADGNVQAGSDGRHMGDITGISTGYASVYVNTGYANVTAAGSNAAHNNMQPSLVCTKIIKF